MYADIINDSARDISINAMIRFSIPLRMKSFRYNILFNSSKSIYCSHLRSTSYTIASMAQESKGSETLPKLTSLEFKNYNRMAVHMDFFVSVTASISRAPN